MSLAFQISDDDIATVLERAGKLVRRGDVHTVDGSERLFEEIRTHIELQNDRITDAALYGGDLDAQTAYAYQEIAQILHEAILIMDSEKRRIVSMSPAV